MENPFQAWNNTLIQHRHFLVSFAFRMTGSLAEAEDIVQETFLECAMVPPSQIENPKAWLTKICSNKALDHLKSAQKKREIYPGTWLPDEVPESLEFWRHLVGEQTPESNVLLSEGLTTSFLLLLERLNPEERVVYLLSEVFEYAHKDIGLFLNKNEEACRKISQRSRQAMASGKTKFKKPLPDSEKLIARFFSLLKEGNISELTKMMAPESELWGDGGGKMSSAGFVQEISKMAEFFQRLSQSEIFKSSLYKLEFQWVNSRPGAVITKELPSGERVFDTILSFEIDQDKITRIYAQRSPDKLAALMKISSHLA